MGKCITDAFGKVKHWVLSDNDFVYEYSNYERDAYTGRYYRLTESTSLTRSLLYAAYGRRKRRNGTPGRRGRQWLKPENRKYLEVWTICL